MAGRNRWGELAALAAARCGVTIMDDARAVGIAPRTYTDRASREGWACLGGGARLLPGAPLTDRAIQHAALAVLGPSALLSHRTALLMHDLSRWPEPDGLVHVVVDYACTRKPTARVRRHRSRRLGTVDATIVDGLRVTSPARTLLDVAADSTRGRLEGMMIQGRRRGRLRGDDLRLQLDRRPNVRGAARFRRALDVMEDPSVDSILEHRTRELLCKHQLPVPTAQYPIRHLDRRVVVDFAWPGVRVALECDGRAFHGDDAFQRDRDRWNVIRAAGWSIVWVTWQDVHDRPLELVRTIRHAIAT